ncbi:MAG: hypothetical protein FJ312_02780 [SAR202 cluster bacterium]|nr:hypothetical protein [SAR202 cluster bacterium]
MHNRAMPPLMFGMKVYLPDDDPRSMPARMRGLGVTTVFCGDEYGPKLPAFREACARAGLQFYLIATVFRDPKALAADPTLLSLGSAGGVSRWRDSEFYQLVCPARDDYLDRRIEKTHLDIEFLRPDGLSLDFIRYYVRREQTVPDHPPEAIEKFCFCDHCLAIMRALPAFAFPHAARDRRAKAAWVLESRREEWTAWRCGIIARAVSRLAGAARSVAPNIGLAIHGVPWTSEEYDGARRVVAGQDIGMLAPLVDFFHPMCYFHMMRRRPEWTHDIAVDYARSAGRPVLPCVQVNPFFRKGPIAPATFRRHVEAALKPPSPGINVWEWALLKDDPAKVDVLKSEFERAAASA